MLKLGSANLTIALPRVELLLGDDAIVVGILPVEPRALTKGRHIVHIMCYLAHVLLFQLSAVQCCNLRPGVENDERSGASEESAR